MKNRKHVSIAEFKRLLHNIYDRRPDVCIRIRLLGQMWSESFFSIECFEDDGVLLFDEHLRRYLRITKVSDVMQFELECPFFGFQAHYHYEMMNVSETLSSLR
jgi:hypothetical protein